MVLGVGRDICQTCLGCFSRFNCPELISVNTSGHLWRNFKRNSPKLKKYEKNEEDAQEEEE